MMTVEGGVLAVVTGSAGGGELGPLLRDCGEAGFGGIGGCWLIEGAGMAGLRLLTSLALSS